MKRRKIRKYRAGKKNSGVKFLWIVGIIIVAVVCGYLTARFIVGPMLGYDTEVLKIDFPSNVAKTSNSDSKYTYAIQYGLFSDKEKAELLLDKLKDANIKGEVMEKKGKYKVISNKCNKKEEALECLRNVPTDKIENAFVTNL